MEQTDYKPGTEQKVAKRVQRQVIPVVQEESYLIDEDELDKKKTEIIR